MQASLDDEEGSHAEPQDSERLQLEEAHFESVLHAKEAELEEALRSFGVSGDESLRVSIGNTLADALIADPVDQRIEAVNGQDAIEKVLQVVANDMEAFEASGDDRLSLLEHALHTVAVRDFQRADFEALRDSAGVDDSACSKVDHDVGRMIGKRGISARSALMAIILKKVMARRILERRRKSL